MFYYKGAKEMGYIQPRTLASYDIVITTYETLGTASRFVILLYLLFIFSFSVQSLCNHWLSFLFLMLEEILFHTTIFYYNSFVPCM
jgi:hypothetical protein